MTKYLRQFRNPQNRTHSYRFYRKTTCLQHTHF